jgi:aspartyl-tRNA(Asn)/glutamyl-tRNA(Gln) amidotransferase subunit C
MYSAVLVEKDGAGGAGESTETLTAGPGLPASMSDSAVDPEEVRHVASLARVDLDAEEVERFTEQFADILDSFERLDEVPETEAEPDLTNVMRPDEEREPLSQDEALKNAPESEAGYFKGPKVS